MNFVDKLTEMSYNIEKSRRGFWWI